MALLDEEICPWQALVNEAHKKWQANPSWSFAHLLGNVSNAERAAMILAKLNYQVNNGGFVQWIDNGYAAPSIHWLRKHLRKMGPASKQVWLLAELAIYLVGDNQEWGDEMDGVVENEVDRTDDKFYELQDEWHKEVYAYLERVFAVC